MRGVLLAWLIGCGGPGAGQGIWGPAALGVDSDEITVSTTGTCTTTDSGQPCEIDTGEIDTGRTPGNGGRKDLDGGCTCRGTGGSFGAWILLPLFWRRRKAPRPE